MAVGADGRLYAAGGFGPTNETLSTVEIYDPATNRWGPDRVPPTVQSFQIQAGAPAASNRTVTLSIQALDDQGELAGVRFSNDDGTTWSSWELSAGEGAKTVSVQVQDAAENPSQTASDTITFDATATVAMAVTISGGALASTSSAVTLAILAGDTGGSGIVEMSFTNDDGATWSSWEAVTPTKAWTLAAGNGLKAVNARVWDAAGNVSNTVSAEITLDTRFGTRFAVWINSTAVSLSMSAAPGTAQMVLSNDDGFQGAVWEPFTTQKAWNLDTFVGDPVTMIVYVRFGTVNSIELPNSRSKDRRTLVAMLATSGANNGLRAVHFDSFGALLWILATRRTSQRRSWCRSRPARNRLRSSSSTGGNPVPRLARCDCGDRRLRQVVHVRGGWAWCVVTPVYPMLRRTVGSASLRCLLDAARPVRRVAGARPGSHR